MFSASKSSAPASGGLLSKSLRFRSSASAYLSRTPSVAGNRKTWTYSAWVKRGQIGRDQTIFSAGYSTNPWFILQFDAADTLDVAFTAGTSVGTQTTAVYRDSSAWYHIVCSVDTTQATASNRMKLYVNGIQVTSFSNTNYPSQNTDYQVNSTVQHTISYGAWYFDGYMADINFIDGQQLTPSSFGSTNATTGQWSPAKYSGSYGTNGFHLTFANTTSTTTLGYDTSGNSNNWTTNNISLTAGSTYDSMNDVPVAYSATAANYCVLNPNNKGSSVTLSDGNLNYSVPIVAAPSQAFSTIGLTTGKWYAELTLGAANFMFGIWGNGSSAMTPNAYTTYYFDIIGYTGYFSLEKSSGTITGIGGGTAVVGNVYGLAIDVDAATLSFYQNNTLRYTVSGMSFTGSLFITVGVCTGSQTGASTINFGQQPFTYTPPSGYNALNTYNLPTPTIAQGNKYMDATLYTGNSSTQSITNAGGFKPDLVWGKDRSEALNNRLFDAVRGVSKALYSNNTTAETTESGVTAFNSNGFTLGSDQGLNFASDSYVAWQWQAGAGSSSSNTNGTITSTVSVSTTAGFSILSYAGGQGANFTIGHGLSTAPSLIIAKSRSATADWGVYYTVNGVNTNYMVLDTTAAQGSNGGTLAGGAYLISNSTTLQVGQTSFANAASSMIAYCWIPIAGFSAFGSYTGNGSTTGPFIYTGFQPKYVMVKRTDSNGNWVVLDEARSTYNSSTNELFPNLSNAEDTSGNFTSNILSNGFQVTSTNSDSNASGGTYIYACFASNPFAYSNAH